MELDKAIKIFEEGMHKNICKHQEFAFCHDEDGAFYHAMLAEEHAQMAEWLRELKRLRAGKWIPVSEKMPEEHEWIGTKRFGTTMSNEVYVTFETPKGDRFAKHLSFQNGKLSLADQQRINAFYKGSVPVAWMPLPEPYKGGKEE
jgi:hypothetical protein